MCISRTLTVHLDHVALRVKHIRFSTKPTTNTLVFLHDALGSIPQWKLFPELVSKKCGMDAIVYERQGHGDSSPFDGKRNRQYLHEQALEALPKLLKELNINRPILIGHSDGGSIALIHGAHFQTEAIVTIAAHIFVEEVTLKGIREARQIASTLKPLLQKYHGEKTEALFNAWHETWLSDAFKDWSIVSDIHSINSPVLAIQGESDAYGSINQVSGILEAVTGPSKKLIVQNTGHLPHLEQAELLAIEISRFLQESNRAT